MRRSFVLFLVLSMVLGACAKLPPGASPTPTPEAGLPTPVLVLTQAPDVEKEAQAYLDAWKSEDYEGMYARLSKLTRDALTLEDFIKQHKNAAVAMTMQEINYAVLSSMVRPTSAQVNYEISYTTTLLGTITRSAIMNLALEEGAWKVQWDVSMILPELAGGNKLELTYEIPARGNLYDIYGYPLVAQDDAVALGVIPGQIDPEKEANMLNLLANILDVSSDSIYKKYQYAQSDWYVAIGDVSAAVAQKYSDRLSQYPGLIMSSFRSRYYYDGGIAPHVIGYVLSISPEQLEEYQRLGYRGDEKIGATGLEAWGEAFLAGTHGASLYVKDPQGQVVTKLASAKAKPAASIYTTIDSTLQYYLQRSMGNNLGAIVVMERDTGKVLAMVSNPGFNPNLFEPVNYNSMMLSDVLADPKLPLYNRASQGVYPLGSVFKIITMAAALETGVFTPDYPYYCDDKWTELAGTVLYDWTYERGFGASGLLSLKEGLMRSCNPWFWHIGLTLWNDGYESAIADVAAGFGLGKKTGIEIPDFEGRLEQPASVSENVQLAIGQGTLQVSPLQVAAFVAAVGNGGTLYKPTVVEKIVPVDGTEPVYEFKPVINGKLPVTPENLQAIQEAMVMVVRNTRGTAAYQFRGLSVNIAGKTGTAENPAGDSHAWFAGYTFNNNPNRPDIAVAIILENAGEGSDMAAPLFRRVVQLYFSNYSNAGGTMPWEESPYVVKTQTPEP
ncbi:MAG TPA: penicillin-binding transpeptidase domain-containing protein [Anaerolineaceae bacterium]|nr:penicillin-binding transpeptidase domain-containing protein [Anaerolineaceae bacterium]